MDFFVALISVQREITQIKSMVKYDKSVLFNMNKKLHDIIYINIVSDTRGQAPLYSSYDSFDRICQLFVFS